MEIKFMFALTIGMLCILSWVHYFVFLRGRNPVDSADAVFGSAIDILLPIVLSIQIIILIVKYNSIV